MSKYLFSGRYISCNGIYAYIGRLVPVLGETFPPKAGISIFVGLLANIILIVRIEIFIHIKIMYLLYVSISNLVYCSAIILYNFYIYLRRRISFSLSTQLGSVKQDFF